MNEYSELTVLLSLPYDKETRACKLFIFVSILFHDGLNSGSSSKIITVQPRFSKTRTFEVNFRSTRSRSFLCWMRNCSEVRDSLCTRVFRALMYYFLLGWVQATRARAPVRIAAQLLVWLGLERILWLADDEVLITGASFIVQRIASTPLMCRQQPVARVTCEACIGARGSVHIRKSHNPEHEWSGPSFGNFLRIFLCNFV